MKVEDASKRKEEIVSENTKMAEEHNNLMQGEQRSAQRRTEIVLKMRENEGQLKVLDEIIGEK